MWGCNDRKGPAVFEWGKMGRLRPPPPHGLSMTQQIEQGLSLARALRDQDSADTQTIQRLFRSMLQMIPILYALNVKINLLTS